MREWCIVNRNFFTFTAWLQPVPADYVQSLCERLIGSDILERPESYANVIHQ